MRNFFRKKEKGAINHIMSLMAILLIAVLFLCGMYFRNIEKLSILTADSVDASNLATAVVDSNIYGQTENYFRIIGPATLENGVSQKEAEAFNKHLGIYTTSLRQNLGLNEGFVFSPNGPAGYAVNQFIGGYNGGDNIEDKRIVIDQFSVYDIVLDKSTGAGALNCAVVEYTATNITDANTYISPLQIQKTIYRNGDGCSITLNPAKETLSASTITTPDGTVVVNPTVYSKISFRLKAPSIYENRVLNPSGNNEIERIVYKESSADITRGQL